MRLIYRLLPLTLVASLGFAQLTTHLGQPGRDVEKIELHGIALPFIGAVAFGIQAGKRLKIGYLLIGYELVSIDGQDAQKMLDGLLKYYVRGNPRAIAP